jgi:hypothetical protein
MIYPGPILLTDEQVLCLAQVLTRVSKRSKELALTDLADWNVLMRAQSKITDMAEIIINADRESRR